MAMQSSPVSKIQSSIITPVAGLGVATVTVGTTVYEMYTAYNEVVAEEGVQRPEGRVLHRNTLDQNTVTAVEVDQLGTHTVLYRHLTFVNRFAGFAPSKQFGTSAAVLSYHTLFPAIFLGTAHGPPCLHGTLSVDDTFTGDGQVGLAEGINQRAHIVAVNAFPTGKHGRHIEFGVSIEFQHGTLFEVEVYIAFEGDGAGIESAGRDNYGTATSLITSYNGQIDGIVTGSLGGVGFSSEIGNVESAIGERGFLNRLFKLGSLFPRVLGRELRRNQGRSQKSAQEEQVFFHTIKFMDYKMPRPATLHI